MNLSEPVCRLALLPPELLQVLSLRLSWKHIGRLLLTGNKRMMQSLRRPGAITLLEVDVETNLDSNSARWPVLFESFRHVHKLSAIATDSYRTRMEGLELEKLPPTLKWLHLHWHNVHDDFAQLYPTPDLFNVAHLFPNLTTLQCRINIADKTADWPQSFPPSLTTIHFGKWNSSCALPDTVTEMHIQDRTYVDSTVVLPSQLRHLRFADEIEGDLSLLLVSLPPVLEHLQFGHHFSGFPIARYGVLPRELRTLKLTTRSATPSHDFSDLELPPNLTELSMCAPTTLAQIKSLPKTLTSLSLESIPSKALYSVSDIMASVSSELKTLELHGERNADLYMHHGSLELPPNLTKFGAEYLDLDQDALNSIPPTIRRLRLGVLRSSLEMPHWPVLKSLSAKNMSLMPSVLSRISANLTSISISSHLWNERLAEGDPLRDLTTEERHEEWLRQFYLFPFHFSYGFEKLDIDSCDYIGDEVIAKIPPTITYLSVAASPYITNEGIKFLAPFISLVTLDLSKAPITGEGFKFFPPSLRFLEASAATGIEDNHIKDLPRSLLYIYMSNATSLTNDCGPFIPPKTTTFRIEQNQIIDSNIAPLLPKTFRTKGSTFVTRNLRLDAGLQTNTMHH